MTPLEAAAALEAQAEKIEAQNAKLVALGLASSCACSVDAPGEVCVHHSPLLTKAHARIAALEQAAAPFVAEANNWADGGDHDRYWYFWRHTVDGDDDAALFTLHDVRALAHAAGGGE